MRSDPLGRPSPSLFPYTVPNPTQHEDGLNGLGRHPLA
jgi:hypothetical protein